MEADPSELALAEWVTPTVAHARWQAASVRLGPPLAALLRAFLRGPALDVRAVRQAPGADGSPSLRYEVLPGIQCLPLRSPTLPPATHTNTFIVGTGEAVLVEPASPYPEEVDRAVAWVEENARAGVHVKAIVATHHHADHIGGAVALKERLGLPLWAHTRTRERLAGAVEVERELADGERLELGGTTPMELSAVLTPGHAPGHLCFRDGASGALLAGDMVAGVGTILIEPTDGDMGLYLESLRRMAASEPSVLLPAHGGPIDDVQGLLAHYVQHRLAREARVFEALADADGPVTAAELVPVAYADARPAVWPIATLAAEAHLLYLERQGRATRVEGGRWRPVRS